MVKNPECPVCGKVLSDGRGLNGHLRMAHQLTGEEHEEKMEEAMSQAEERQPDPAPPGVESLLSLVERVATHRGESPLEVWRSIRKSQESLGDDYIEIEESKIFQDDTQEETAIADLLDEVEEALEKRKEDAEAQLHKTIETEVKGQ